MVVELDPVADHSHRMLLGFEAVAVSALLLQRANDALDHAVLLRAVRCDELLLQAVAANQPRVVPAGEHQSVVRAQQERYGDALERAKAADQRLLQSRGSGGRATAARQLPAQQLSGVAVDHQGQRQPAIPAAPDAAQVGRPTLTGPWATDGKAWMRGRRPTARLRTCHPLSWKIRCTVFLFMPSSPATVR